MRVSGHGAEAVLPRLLREETTTGASTGKNNSQEENANSVSKTKEKQSKSLPHDQHLIT